MATNNSGNPLLRLLQVTTRIEPNELAAVLLSFALVFVLMTSYMVLKPLRDAMAADWGNVGLSITWTANFGVSLIAITLYGVALTYVRFRTMVPGIYVFFALAFVALFVVRTQSPDPVLVNKGFYVWVSVFNLFNLSVFWSFMTDIYSQPQAKRLFGFIAAGATVGSIVGPILTASLVDDIGANGLLLISAGLLVTPVFIMPLLRRIKLAQLGNEDVHADLSKQQSLGKNPFSGFSILFSDRYMIGIGAFILIYVMINTFVYFELQNLTEQYSLEFRAKIWSWIEITTNVLTLLTAAAITGRIVTKFGMSTTLALVPGLIAVGILALVAAPTLPVLAAFHIARRAGNYAITRPGREMLYTVLDRETRFKSKPVIDVVLYRGGDVMSAWVFTLLAVSAGFGLAQIAMVISGIAVVWTGVAIWLGRAYESRVQDPDASNKPTIEGELHGTA